jgi:excisionase family DNA binding protein
MTEHRPNLRPKQFCEDYGVSRATLYRLLASGTLTARKNGRATLIDGESVQRWRNSLPAFESRATAAVAA